MHLRHPRIVTALLLVFALAAGACGGSGDDESDVVTIYSGRTENLIGPILDEFVEATGTRVRVRYGQSADLALLIEEEAAAGEVQADVFLSQSPGSMGFLQGNGRLATLPDSVLELVPAEVRDDGGAWVGFSGRKRVLVYDPERVTEEELPDSVFDLTAPEWKGRVGIAPANGSFQDFVTSMRATEGDDATADWLAGMAANDVVEFPNNNAIVAAVGRGEVDAGLVNHYYNYRFQAEDPSHRALNHDLAPGDPGSLLVVTGAAVLADSGQPGRGADLIEFLLGDTGQRYFAEETFEYPLALGQEPVAAVPTIDFNDSDIAYEDLGGGLAATRDLIIDAGLTG